MRAATRIRLEEAATASLPPAQELTLVRAAYDRRASTALRSRLAGLLHRTGDAAGVIDLLAGRPDLRPDEQLRLATALVARRAEESRSTAAAQLALAVATGPEQRCAALALQAELARRSGDDAAALAALGDALSLNPGNVAVSMHLVQAALTADRPEWLLDRVEPLIETGTAHAWLFAARGLALACLGRTAEARHAMGVDRLTHAERLTPPDGWDDIHTFNRALAEELVTHPALRQRRYGSDGMLSWRIDAPLDETTPLLRALLERIRHAIAIHIERLVGIDDPWVRAAPSDATLHGSGVVTDADGYEAWHLHPFAWLSGAYYVEVPEEVVTGIGEAGCIALGLPETLVGTAADAYGQTLIRPTGGTLLLFPSHIHHRTYPHGLKARRICLAIDLRPTG